MRTSYPAPIYRDDARRYEIDTCEPQREAVRRGVIELHALSKGHYPGVRMELNILPGLATVGYWDSRREQDWGVGTHRNEGLELAFLETGELGFEVDGREHLLRAGSLTATRPWQAHRLGRPHIGRGRLHWLILDVGVRRPNQDWQWPQWVMLARNDLAELTRRLRGGDEVIWAAPVSVGAVFHEIAACVTGWHQPHAASRLGVAINRLLLAMLEMPADRKQAERPELAGRRRTVELFLRDLAVNPQSAGEPWQLPAMAECCGMGVTALAKYCRELVNTGPVAYLNLCRLDHAARQLRERPDQSVTSVALEAGFGSSQYFATLFRQRFGMTPGQWRTRGGRKASRKERNGLVFTGRPV